MSRVEDLQQAERIRSRTGFPVRIGVHDSIVKMHEESDSITLLVRRVKVRETLTQTYGEAATLYLFSFSRDFPSPWKREVVVLADSEFVPWVRQEWGATRSPEEHRAHLAWEAECGHPGDGSRLGERDTIVRAWAGYTDDARVRDVWREHINTLSRSESVSK